MRVLSFPSVERGNHLIESSYTESLESFLEILRAYQCAKLNDLGSRPLLTSRVDFVRVELLKVLE